MPRDIYVVDALPRNGTGKILRRHLAIPAQPATGQTHAAEALIVAK